jgi:hypothetical protein
MIHKIAFTALSLAIALGGASGALAGGKKHNEGGQAYASGASVADPRHNEGRNHQSFCDVDAQCNGWATWLADVKAGKLKN